MIRIFVKNETDGSILLPEVNTTIQSREERELTGTGGYGDDWQAARRAIFELTDTVLYQQRVTGDLTFRYVIGASE